jgi:hypothetical protein
MITAIAQQMIGLFAFIAILLSVVIKPRRLQTGILRKLQMANGDLTATGFIHED